MTEANQPTANSKLWKIRYYGSRVLDWVRSKSKGLFLNRFVSLFLPWITGTYFLLLDVWGDDWAWIKDYRHVHSIIFWGCLLVSLITQFGLGVILSYPKLESDKEARNILNEFIENVGLIVQAKLDRFRQKLESVKHGSDKFKHITMPREQIQVIGNAAVRFLRSVYGLKEDDIEITVLRRKDGGSWSYLYQFQDWSHGSPEWLLDRNSAANQCSASGESAFFADKIAAAKRGKYVLSDRDKRRGLGSVYIYPVRFTTPSFTMNFVISIVTYRIPFCPDVDDVSSEITVSFLREICRRFEIELCLDTIKSV